MKKTCKCCKKELDINEFYKTSSYKDGYFSKCKDCMKKKRTIEKEKSISYYQKKLKTSFKMYKDLETENLNLKRQVNLLRLDLKYYKDELNKK